MSVRIILIAVMLILAVRLLRCQLFQPFLIIVKAQLRCGVMERRLDSENTSSFTHLLWSWVSYTNPWVLSFSPSKLGWCLLYVPGLLGEIEVIYLKYSFYFSFQRGFYYLFIWLCSAACGILVPQPGIKCLLAAMKVQSLNHWITRKVPKYK